MRIDRKHLKRAHQLAMRCNFRGYGVGAVVVLNRGVVSEGWAHMSDLRLNELWSIHAEIHALGRARHLDLEGAVVYTFAYRKPTGATVLSKPCLTCAIALKAAGVNSVVYTVNNQLINILDLEADLSNLKDYTVRKYDS